MEILNEIGVERKVSAAYFRDILTKKRGEEKSAKSKKEKTSAAAAVDLSRNSKRQMVAVTQTTRRDYQSSPAGIYDDLMRSPAALRNSRNLSSSLFRKSLKFE